MKVIFDNLTDGQAALLVGVISAAFLAIGAGINSIISFLKDKSIAKREMRRLAIEAALETWRHQNLIKIDWAKSEKDARVSLDSPDSYIIHMLRIMDVAADMKLTSSEAANRLIGRNSGDIKSADKPNEKNEDTESGPGE